MVSAKLARRIHRENVPQNCVLAQLDALGGAAKLCQLETALPHPCAVEPISEIHPTAT
jgi:hypothetical protein